MGLLEKIFKRPRDVRGAGFETFTESAPMFTSYDGSMYQQELTRACIDRFAHACEKLKPEITGSSKPWIRKFIETNPNDFMTWPQFFYRAATIYDNDCTVAIVPVFSRDMTRKTGLYPLKFEFAEVVTYAGEPWVRFHMATGKVMAIELAEICLVSKYQYRSDLFGETNCLDATMELIHAQNEAQKNAIKTGAAIRFIGALSGQVREEDLKEKRKRFSEENLSSQNGSGIVLYDTTFTNVQQIQPYHYTVDAAEMNRIKDNVYTYFATNEDILQNKYDEETWGAYYEGRVEPFAVSLGEGLTKMLFSNVEISHGNRISFSSNRLEYASNASKRNMVRDMLDRGVMSLNEAREVLQLPPVPGGDVRVIRGEYVNADTVNQVVVDSTIQAKELKGESAPMNEHETDRDPGGDDDIYNDSDSYGKDDFK